MTEVVITGVGMVSCAGDGIDANRAALASRAPPRIDSERFRPCVVHPVVPLDWDRQIPKRLDQRQMEDWQRLGVFAAGQALDNAGLKTDEATKARMHAIVAAGGGERDYEVDAAILTGLRGAEDPDRFLNERLTRDLRPTLFLAQLSNLLAGNIAIVHGVTGSSRTFMGEETSGADALRIARERIVHGQGDVFLVGASYNAERPDILLIYEMGGFLWKAGHRPVWDRPRDGGGFIPASGACFVVLESRDHAEARGATILATVIDVAVARTRRRPGDVAASLRSMWRLDGGHEPDLILSGATGVSGITEEEDGVLGELAGGTRRFATADTVGHTLEAHPLMGFGLAAASIAAGSSRHVIVTSVGHHHGEAVIRLRASA
jgi:3-oxoacyl-[acyl-carrier-protein] synthase II